MTARDDAEVVEAVAAAIDAEWMRPEHGCGGDPDACQQACPFPAYARMGLDELRDAAAAALLPLIREREAAAWERALREAADKWQTGAWAALTEPIKAERQAQRIIGAAQVVLDWLRDRAAANPYAGSEGA